MVGRDKLHTDYLNKLLYTTNTMTGVNVPVSDFLDTATGMVPNGTAAYEKRGIAADVPHWEMANCIQCNMCSYVCPHGVIRPFVLDEKEAEPIKDSVLPMRGEEGKYFAIGISTWTAQAAAHVPMYVLQRTKHSPCMLLMTSMLTASRRDSIIS